jgi:hypothetical protein
LPGAKEEKVDKKEVRGRGEVVLMIAQRGL